MHRPKRILISHVYSVYNNGDAALLSVLMSDLRRQFGDPAITILTLDSTQENEHFDRAPMSKSFMFYAMKRFRSKHLTLVNALFVMAATIAWAYTYKCIGKSLPIGRKLEALCALYASTDLVIPVGGGYLRSQKDGVGSLLNVALLLHPLKLAHILHKPTVLYTQSIGPFASALEERVVAHALNTYVSAALLRENITVELLQRIGVTDHMYRSVDSGFGFTPDGIVYDVRKKLNIRSDAVVFGITARQWLIGEAQTNYERALAEVAQYIVKKYHAAVVFIPQVTAEYHGDDDRIVQARILQKVHHTKDIYAIDDILSHHEIKAVYNSLDFVIGTRFHSVIFSLTSYVPALAIEYEYKTRGIMLDLDLDNWVVRIEDVNTEDICQKVDDLVAERESYVRHLKAILPAYIHKTDNAISIVATYYNDFVTAEPRI